MSNTIKFRRGLEASLPTLADGEPAWCTDNFKLYVGSGGVNRLVGGVSDHGALSGLADDDHTQYLLASGARALTADWNAGVFSIAAKNVKLTDLTDGYAPYHVNDATGLANSPIFTNSSFVGINATTMDDYLHVKSNVNTRVRVETSNDTATAAFALRRLGGVSGLYDNLWYIYIPASSKDLRIYDTADRFTVEAATGNLGIGDKVTFLADTDTYLQRTGTNQVALYTYGASGFRQWGTATYVVFAFGYNTVVSDDLFNMAFTPTNDNAANMMQMAWAPTITVTGTYNNYCLSIAPAPIIDAGVTNSGLLAAAVIDVRASDIGFAGTLASMTNAYFYAGMTSGVAGTATISGNIINVNLRTWYGGGTVTGSIYDLYINSPVVGGTLVGTYYPIYVVSANLCYFGGLIGIGVNAKSSKMTYGLIINQASSSDEILVLQSATDLGHSMSDYADADTYGHFLKVADAPGGLKIRGFTDSDGTALEIDGFIGTATPTATIPAIKLVAAKYNGATGVQALAATETALQLSTNGTNLITILGHGHTKINSGTATAYPPTLTLKGGPGTGANEGPSLWLEHGYAAEDWKNGCIWTAGSGYGVNYASTMYFGVNFGSTANDVQQVFNITGTTAACYINLGANDSVLGIIRLYGNGVGSTYGGVAALYTAADYDGTIDYFGISVIEDDLQIGPNTDGDALKLDSNKDLWLTDGDMNLQVGGTTTIVLQASGSYIYVGTNDTTAGHLVLYGAGAATAGGGQLYISLAADYDGTIGSYLLQAYEDDLWIGPDTNGNMITLTAQSVLQLDDGVTEQFYKALGTDHTASGISETFTAGEALVFGDVCYFKSDGKMWKADADAATTMPVKAMALASISADASGKFLLFGWVRDDTWAWTVGGLIYASVTGGALSQTAPSGSGDQVQVVGWAYSADIMFFNPNYAMVELV